MAVKGRETMWISEMAASARREVPDTAGSGEVTIGGADAGVYTSYEARGAIVASPGGYSWRPRAGDGVLVMKGGSGESYIAGRLDEGPEGLGEGEVRISSGGGAVIILRNNGDVVIRGHMVLEGTLDVNGTPYRPCTCAVLGG